MGKSVNSWRDCTICSKQRGRCKNTNSDSQKWNAYQKESKHGTLSACPHVMMMRIMQPRVAIDAWKILRMNMYISNIINYWYSIILNRKCIIIQRRWRSYAYRVPNGVMFCIDLQNYRNEFEYR
jgi:hypothetical protein